MADNKTTLQLIDEISELLSLLKKEDSQTSSETYIVLSSEQYWLIRGWPKIPPLDLWKLDLP